jgi:hypothetical protein
VGIGGDQGDSGQAAGGQVAEEPQPARAVLGGGDLQAQDLPVALGVHAGRDQRVHVHGAAVLADLQHQRVRGHERIRAGVQRPGPERLHLRVQIRGHHRHLRLRQRGDAQRRDQLLHPPRGHPEQIRRGHHRDQRRLGAAAALQQPVREVAAVAASGSPGRYCPHGYPTPAAGSRYRCCAAASCARRTRHRKRHPPPQTSVPPRTCSPSNAEDRGSPGPAARAATRTCRYWELRPSRGSSSLRSLVGTQ